MAENEVDLDDRRCPECGNRGPLQDAIDLASDQDQMTWMVSDGKRVAAIVPVDWAEYELLIRTGKPS
jgi:hypothetical protein